MSSIILYKDSKIIPSKNFIVEGIETYLAGLTKITILDYQYLRNDLNLSIKINKTQDFSESIFENNYNYLKVVQGGVNYYYFVAKKTQIAQSTIVLDLVMDTLNTYPWGTAFSVSPRTRVIREHKDRIKESPLFNATLSGLSLSGSSIIIEANTPFLLEDYDGNTIEVISPTGDRIDPYAYINLDIRPTNETDAQTIRNGFIPDTFIFGETRFAFNEGEIEIDSTFKNYERIIDYYSEGITPVLYKQELGNLEDKENLTWNLIYRNATDDSNTAIQCFAVPSDGEVKVIIPAKATLTYTDFEDGVHYLFAPWNGVSYSLVDNNGKKYNVRPKTYDIICKDIRRSGTTLQIRGIHYKGSVRDDGRIILAGAYTVYSWYTITSISFELDEIYYYKNVSVPTPSQPGYMSSSNGYFSSTTSTSNSLTTLGEVDRVEPKLIKIISIPYFPSNYTYDSENFEMALDETWTYENTIYSEGSLALNDLNVRFSRIVESSIDNPLNVFNLYQISTSPTSLRNDLLESKLFHSDFYQPKFVYDSFGFVFELEKIDEELFNPSEKFTFEFVMTSTINSKFMFKFPEYILKLSTQDYDNILPVSRNNEAPIYNSSYITYLRTAYRYDLKFLSQNTNLAWLGIATGTIDSVVNSGAGKGNGAMAFYNIASGMTNAITRSIVSLNSNEWNLQSKMEGLKNQANSVSGSDDLDLLENYSGNRAKLCLYQVSPRMKNLLADLFYYFGYTTDEIKIPEVNTRYWFNFLSCNLEFTGLDKNISELARDNLVQRYNAGATFLHQHNSEWDFEQIKENWETSLL